MPKSLLLTSFATWMPHQVSNSADDLLIEMLKKEPPLSWQFLRQLPVDFELAPQQAIAHFDRVKPDILVCCGMAESRAQLSVESRAITAQETIQTTLNLNLLIADLSVTEISHDAGQFVCNALYYAMLKHLRSHSQSQCVFVHVPVLTNENREAIAADFHRILQRLTA
jgi:pyroglutamyl-peptidase